MSNYPADVTTRDIDNAATNPLDRYNNDALWRMLTEDQRDAIITDFLASDGVEIVLAIEDADWNTRGEISIGKAAKARWHNFRNSGIEELGRDGLIQLPD